MTHSSDTETMQTSHHSVSPVVISSSDAQPTAQTAAGGSASMAEHQQKPHLHANPALDAIIGISMAAEFLRTQVDKAVAPLHITGVQYNILRVLKRAHPEGLSRTEILRHLIEKSVDVTRSIDGLIRLGFVRRERPEQDRRLSITSITDEGIEALHRTDPLFYSMMSQMGQGMGEAEFRELSHLCHKLMSSVGEPPSLQEKGASA